MREVSGPVVSGGDNRYAFGTARNARPVPLFLSPFKESFLGLCSIQYRRLKLRVGSRKASIIRRLFSLLRRSCWPHHSNCKFGDQPVLSLDSSSRPLIMQSIK